MKIIGSYAIKHHFPDFNRVPKDIDFAYKDNIINTEYYNIKKEFLYNPILTYTNNIEYASPDEILTLKISHIFLDIFWDKHMYDIQFLLSKGCKIQKDLFYKLYNFWKTEHPNKMLRSNLAMSAKDFFNNAIKCPYNHDYLHTLLNETPIYTKILEDNEEVLVSEKKFDGLTFDEKCDLVREEVMVMAYERYYELNYKIAYSKMLKKFIMNHAPLWEALFIIENYVLLHKPKVNYFKIINQKLNEKINI